MKKQFLSFLLLLLFAACVSAQTNEARKVDEFGEIFCDDMIGRLGNLGIGLKGKPESIAFIISYEGKYPVYSGKKKKYILPRFGESNARTQAMKERLYFLQYDPKKFIFIDGGFREKYTVEFWIVPKGAIPPKSTPTLKTIKYRKGNPPNFCGEF